MINKGDFSEKPGWIRLSLHPTMTDSELDTVINALREIQAHASAWSRDYTYDRRTNEYRHRDDSGAGREKVKRWFNLQS
jgi:hypothetical protein